MEIMGEICRNQSEKWASTKLAVKKPGSSKMRITVDLRCVNRRTVPMESAITDLEGMWRSVTGSNVFAKIDMCHEYWQIPRHTASQDAM